MISEFSLSSVIEKIYENQLALEAALMELVLLSEEEGRTAIGENTRGALERIGENAGFIKQGLARLRNAEKN